MWWVSGKFIVLRFRFLIGSSNRPDCCGRSASDQFDLALPVAKNVFVGQIWHYTHLIPNCTHIQWDCFPRAGRQRYRTASQTKTCISTTRTRFGNDWHQTTLRLRLSFVENVFFRRCFRYGGDDLTTDEFCSHHGQIRPTVVGLLEKMEKSPTKKDFLLHSR